MIMSDYPERAKRVAAIANEQADAGDRQGFLADPVVAALHREGLYGMWAPRALGGAELAPVESVAVIETVANGDPSAGWVLMAAALAIGTGGAYLGDAAAEELFGAGRMPVIAGQGTRPGTAKSVDGGYRLTGSWSFASGIKHATHIHTLGIIENTGEPRIFVLPVAKATLVENWDVLGLRGTGSIDYTIDSVFVPEAYTHFVGSEKPQRGGSLYWIGIAGFAMICHAGWACGIGRRVLDEIARYVNTRVGRAGTQSTSESFQEDYARAEGACRAARAFVYETWGDVQQALEQGKTLSLRKQTLIRLAMAQVTSAAQDAAAFAYKAAGTTALRAGVIQRLFRDMHAGTQHVVVSPPVIRALGRELSGLAPGQQWRFLELV
jgi:alkylation response protein AidB-like acyl-CoA dehydrogenase